MHRKHDMGLIDGTENSLLHEGDLPGPHGFSWGFVALQYYAVIANRVVAVLVAQSELVVIRAGRIVIAPHHLTAAWYSPFAYLQKRVVLRYAPMAVGSDEVLKADRGNRRIRFESIQGISFVPTWKWGMGSVPYSGRILVETADKRHELILLGNQRGDHIEEKLRAQVAAAN